MSTTKKQVKGFTLIELIVVMAIFGIILASAMALIQPSSKVMQNSQNMENGSAVVSNIANYIENEISSVEYLSVINSAPSSDDSTTRANYVEEYIKSYYEGALKSGSEIGGSLSYATGDIHVLTIDNNDNGKITRYTYKDVSFNPSNFNIGTPEVETLNKAYYDEYIFKIKSGLYEDDADFAGAPEDYNELLQNISSKNTQFTIKAIKKYHCPNCGADVEHDFNVSACPSCGRRISGRGGSFLYNASMSLVNIYNRSTAGVANRYYVVSDEYDETEDAVKQKIVDITSTKCVRNGTKHTTDNNGTPADDSGDTFVTLNGRSYGSVMLGTKVYYSAGDESGYTFIDSFGSEIDTN